MAKLMFATHELYFSDLYCIRLIISTCQHFFVPGVFEFGLDVELSYRDHTKVSVRSSDFGTERRHDVPSTFMILPVWNHRPRPCTSIAHRTLSSVDG